LERICKEFDEEDKRKLEKAQRKRDLKKIKLKKKKEESLEEKSIAKCDDFEKFESVDDKAIQSSPEVIQKKNSKPTKVVDSPNNNNNNSNNNSVNNNILFNDNRKSPPSMSSKKSNSSFDNTKRIKIKANEQEDPSLLSSSQAPTPIIRRLTRKPCQNNEPFSILSLENMLSGADNRGGEEDDEGGIPLVSYKAFCPFSPT